MNLRNLKIGQKIVAGFSLVAFIALVIGITGIVGMNSMGNSFRKVANVKMSAVYYVGEMDVAVERIYQNYVRLLDPKLSRNQREEIVAKIALNRQSLGEAMANYNKLDKTEEESRIYRELESIIAPWRTINQQIERKNARFIEIDLMHPSQLVAKIEMFMKDHYELELKVINGIQDRATFEGGEDSKKCSFGEWFKEFSSQNAAFNNNLREIRQNHDLFHESVHTIKSYISQGHIDAAHNHYDQVLNPAAKKVFAVFDLLLEEAEQAQTLLEDMSDGITVESAEYHKVFGEKFSQLKELNQQDAVAERESGAATFRNSIIMIVFVILLGVAIAIVLGIVITRNITRGLNNGVTFAERISKGDLTMNLDDEILQQKDEVGKLARALQHMVEQLKNIIRDVMTSTDNINAASEELSSGSQQVSQGASEQASSAEEISSSMEEMVSNVQQNTDNALQTEKIAIQAADGIRRVSENAIASTKAIKDIASKVSIIGDIAYKTNILALNAAVEAARAGEHGHGFAVVADEVRKLAEQSQVAADEIDELSINSVNMADQAGKQLMEIAPEIEKTANLVQEIAAASMEQNSGAEQVNSAVQQLNQVVQQNAAASEEMASSSEELSSQAEQMKEVISYFKVGEGSRRVEKRKSVKKKILNELESEEKSRFSGNPGIKLDMNGAGAHLDDFEKF
ncbi:methyl-accepting chemotaxis protein [Marinilabilia salmonicolor]|jgi:methyl-accepting chemotaxis protein|uniref:methyl-accepting chemotaxis protein n=1 Tax=Marinilabilia salmonicolor TaxID=989 RepID=UPI000D065C85|nr:methyl-accepting chemotaxis protein [Marinilabilia salmonicolor]PRY96930.1 methyl-accepting chemotaxis protein [Marinilabilia salmonicolor]